MIHISTSSSKINNSLGGGTAKWPKTAVVYPQAYISVLNVKVYEDLRSNYTYYHCSFASIFRLIQALWEIPEFQKLITPKINIFEPKII